MSAPEPGLPPGSGVALAWTRHLWVPAETPARRLALAPLVPAAWLYGLGARIHRQAYRLGLRRRLRLPARVISVGNLAVGGSGKTPVVAWLARQIRDRGRRVAVLSRGVGGRRGHEVNVVSDGGRIWMGAQEVGDEPVWLAHALPGVPVLAGRNRGALGLRAASALGAEILILDDGFQHHRLDRDLDLVCIDAALGVGNRYTLPRGPLREPVSALRYADALVLTRAREDLSPLGVVRDASIPVFRLRMVATSLRSLGGSRSAPLSCLDGAEVGVLTAMARPDRLCADLVRHGARVVELRSFPDHYLYRRADLAGLHPLLRWVTTGKDAVKIPPEWVGDVRLDVLEECVEEIGSSAASRPLCDWVLEHLERTAARP